MSALARSVAAYSMDEESAANPDEEAPSDGDLVRAYRDGRVDAAFAELVRRYQTRLFRVVLGMVGDTSFAEELTQRVLVKAALRIRQLKEPQAFYAWTLSIARTTTLDELRKASRKNVEYFEGQSMEEPATTSDPGETQTVRAVLAKLSPDERMVLVMADMQGLSSKEVANALGVKLSAAKMRVKRARDRFRELYGESTT
ncbi:MAG: sigma-70 family RNA polymerase sigma factor [Deltaproteobacteria bacterium]|nr:sigma-70 family RNA polymerase sigma factor [Deltaproteobacteria bacterium]